MKKLAKKLLCLTAVLALTLSLFTGCKSKNEKTLFEYAGQKVTFQEAHVYARIMQYQAEAQYGAYFGDSMWSMQVGTDSKGKKKMSAELDQYHRFDWGVPPTSKGDYAFVLHMLSSLDAENGRMAVVLPHGVLFRGASEGKIRRQLVEMNLLDAVIGLPANLFYGTGIPACILVFKKNRTCRDVLFIDASGDGNFEKGKNQNILRDSDITRIVNAYQARQNEDKYSYVASFDEIKENDFNLNIPRYVDTFEEEELVDIDEVQRNIATIEAELAEVQAKMVEYLKELGL